MIEKWSLPRETRDNVTIIDARTFDFVKSLTLQAKKS
jgi:hypothetical protein